MVTIVRKYTSMSTDTIAVVCTFVCCYNSTNLLLLLPCAKKKPCWGDSTLTKHKCLTSHGCYSYRQIRTQRLGAGIMAITCIHIRLAGTNSRVLQSVSQYPLMLQNASSDYSGSMFQYVQGRTSSNAAVLSRPVVHSVHQIITNLVILGVQATQTLNDNSPAQWPVFDVVH